MLYYLVKYRYIFSFIIGMIIGLLIFIPVDIKIAYVSVPIGIGASIFASMHYNMVGYVLISNKIKGILKKYINKHKKFDFFYYEFVSSNAVSLIDSIMKRYKDLAMTDKEVYTKLSKYKSFVRKTKAVSYDEAINVLAISTLFDEHIQLINEVFYKSNEIDVAQKKVLEEKDEKLAKILEEELATKSKDFKRFGEYYS